MRLGVFQLACTSCVVINAVVIAARCEMQPAARATSPDGQVGIEISLEKRGDAGPNPVYSVSFHGRTTIGPSRLEIALADGSGLGLDSTIEGVRSRTIDESYTQHPGKRSRVVNHCEETVVAIRECAAPARLWEVVIRAYNDGAALRYRFPAQAGWDDLTIAGEHTRIGLGKARSRPYFLLQDSTPRTRLAIKRSPSPISHATGSSGCRCSSGYRKPLGSPSWKPSFLTMRGCTWRAPEGQGVLVSRLSPRPEEPKLAVRAKVPHESPWRAFLIADKLERLVESDLVLNLNVPCALPDTAWIRPGKTTFPWWNGFYEKPMAFKMGLNTETAKYYIDFCAESGVPYHSLDGVDNVAWYGGPIVPYQGADITKGIAGLDLREVLRYAATKGVKIRLWMNWQAAQAHMDRAFPRYREWGVEGVMLDFMDRDDQEMVTFLRRAVKLAAENRLTVSLHGVSAPTGLERTFPNLLTSEAVLNLEYDKWDKLGVPPEHELTVPFTRMLAGPLDFHQGSLRGVPVADFRPRNEAPLVMGTPARMLASYVVFQNHLPMVADYPSAYRGHPTLDLLAKIPATWDDTRCLAGEVGELVVIARRRGKEWWVGAMGGRKSREVAISLDFAGPGRFQAEIIQDDLASASHVRRRMELIGGGAVLNGKLAPAGGILIRLARGYWSGTVITLHGVVNVRF